jgi:hypothetical protein
MKKKSARKCLLAVCLLMTGSSVTPAFATWDIHQSKGYYEPQEYHNNKFGDFVPADINEKLFGHLNTDATQETSKSQRGNTPASSSTNQAVPPENLKVPKPAATYSQQNYWQPSYNRYNQGRNFTAPGNQRYNRNTSFNGPWNNRGTSFSGPWNNRGSNFSGPWNNNGSRFSMPWGNNNGSNFSPWGNGGGWGW